MAKKCCVPGCQSNYHSRKRKKKNGVPCDGEEEESKENAHPRYVPLYRFPANMSEKIRWIAVIPRILSLKDPILCHHHWPSNFNTTTVNSESRLHDLSYDAYHIGIPCTITTLSRNRTYSLDTWSKVDEALRFLHQKETTHHEDVILEQMNNMRPPKVGEKFYSPETMMRAFDYYAHSRSVYRKLRKDLKLPSERTLQKLTSKVSKVGDKTFIDSVFSNVTERQRKCIILIDEMYIKKLMLYHGGSLYGKALNKPDQMANSVLTIMVKCLNGGPSFAFKMLPVAKMDASFVYQQVEETIKMIREAGGDEKSFKLMETEPTKSSSNRLRLYPANHGLQPMDMEFICCMITFIS